MDYGGTSMFLDNSILQGEQTAAMINRQIESLEQLKISLTEFLASKDQLQGMAYDSARDFIEEGINPLIEGIQLLAEKIGQSVAKLPADYTAQVANESLQEEVLRNQIRQLRQLEEAQNLLLAKLPGKPPSLMIHGEARRELETKLEKLLNFNSSSVSIFDGIDADLKTAIEQGFIEVSSAWNPDTGLYVLSQSRNWVTVINNNISRSNQDFEKKYGVKKPEGMSDKDYRVYLTVLRSQVARLESDGWSKEAIKIGYLENVKVSYDPRLEQSIQKQLGESYKIARTFGSPVFQKMFSIDSEKADTPEKAKTVLQISMRYAGMPSELSGDTEETKRLVGSIDSSLAPHDVFWASFSETVRKAYPGDEFAKASDMGDLKRQTHQFRYVISAQQAQWVREHYRKDGMTDEDALVAYAKDHPELEFEAGPSARLHNKAYYDADADKIVYPNDTKNPEHVQKEQANYKVLLGFRTEFILSKDGNFLNEIDAEGATENGIVNGASFNYGEDGSSHKNLDMDTPAVWDPKFRQEIINNIYDNEKHKYVSPNKIQKESDATKDSPWSNSYYNNTGRYGVNGKKYKDLIDKEVQEFKERVNE
ncbi:Ribonuclease [Streptococcus sanguinis]|nr:Ribonuclease [Streptococcus sanguinis]